MGMNLPQTVERVRVDCASCGEEIMQQAECQSIGDSVLRMGPGNCLKL